MSDFIPLYDEDPTDYDDAKCKRCGKTGLHWRDMGLNGVEKWRLFDDRLREHVCKQTTKNPFEDESDED